MPNRVALAASHATGIGADRPAEDVRRLGGRLDAVMPAGPGEIDASSKSLMDLLGEILVPARGSGLPRRLRVTSYGPEKVTMHSAGGGAPVESSVSDFMRLHRGGALQREGPPTEGLSLASLLKRLQDVVG